ncbi:FAD-dependent oxidoreductase (plasmid) [Escherichia coli]
MNIAIIGAGPAGIISARNAIKAGHSVVLFEKNTRIGGIWNPWSGGAYRNACMQKLPLYISLYWLSPWRYR